MGDYEKKVLEAGGICASASEGKIVVPPFGPATVGSLDEFESARDDVVARVRREAATFFGSLKDAKKAKDVRTAQVLRAMGERIARKRRRRIILISSIAFAVAALVIVAFILLANL